MRCHAYLLPSEVYGDIEAQILEQLAQAEREHLLYLLEENDLDVELLSGEWRVLFDAAEDYFQVVDSDKGRARMAVSPEELADFVKLLRDPELQAKVQRLSFGLGELTDALPENYALAGVVFVEESDDWLWVERTNEIVAIRPEVYELLAPHVRALIEEGKLATLGRLAADHAEGTVEFSRKRWDTLMEHARDKVPELLGVVEAHVSEPSDYTAVREALALVSDPRFQPSLDAWLRVHANTAQYALLFRDTEEELSQLDEEEGGAATAAAPARDAAPEDAGATDAPAEDAAGAGDAVTEPGVETSAGSDEPASDDVPGSAEAADGADPGTPAEEPGLEDSRESAVQADATAPESEGDGGEAEGDEGGEGDAPPPGDASDLEP